MLRGAFHSLPRGGEIRLTGVERDLQVERSFLSSMHRDELVNFGAFLLVALGILLVIALPSWPHSRRWGYVPSAAIGAATALVLVLFVTGRL